MIGRPRVQPAATWPVELAGPPVQRNSQSLTHEVVWPVGSCLNVISDRFAGSSASTMYTPATSVLEPVEPPNARGSRDRNASLRPWSTSMSSFCQYVREALG